MTFAVCVWYSAGIKKLQPTWVGTSSGDTPMRDMVIEPNATETSMLSPSWIPRIRRLTMAEPMTAWRRDGAFLVVSWSYGHESQRSKYKTVDCPQDKTWDHCTSSPWRCWSFGPKGLSECKMEEHTIPIGKDHNLLCKNSPQIYCPVAGKTFQTKESQVSSKKVTLCWRDPACKCLISELGS